MIKLKRKTLLYIPLLIVLFFLTGCDSVKNYFEILKDKNYNTYAPSSIPCMGKECVLVCGWNNKNTSYHASDKRNPSYYIYMDVLERKFFIALATIDTSGVVTEKQSLYLLKEGVNQIDGSTFSDKFSIHTENGVDITKISKEGNCPDEVDLIIDASSFTPKINFCFSKKDDNLSWCQNNKSFRSDEDRKTADFSVLKFSLFDVTSPSKNEAKNAIATYYTEKNVFACTNLLKNIKLNKDDLNDVHILINGKRVQADDEGRAEIKKEQERGIEELYSEKTIEDNFMDLLDKTLGNYYSVAPESHKKFTFPKKDEPTYSILTTIKGNFLDTAKNYLLPDGRIENSSYMLNFRNCIKNLEAEIDALSIPESKKAELKAILNEIKVATENAVVSKVIDIKIDASLEKWDDLNCEEIAGQNVIYFLGFAYLIFKIAAPILFIILSMIDFMKATATGEDALKKAISKLAMRAIVVVLIFLLPTLIKIIGNLTGLDTTCINF